MNRYLSHRAAPLVIFLVSVAVTLASQFVLPAQFSDVGPTDFMTKDLPTARAIVTGQPIIGQDAIFPVGFPLIIAGVIQTSRVLSIPFELTLRVLAVLEMGLTAMLIFYLTRVVWSVHHAWLAALLWSTYPFVLWLTTQNGSELTFLVFFLAGLCLFWQAAVTEGPAPWRWIGAGVLLGVSMLIRPIAIGLPALMLLGLWIFRWNRNKIQSVMAGAMFLLGSICAIAPWEILVFQSTGRWVLISDHAAVSMRDGLTFAVDSKDYRSQLSVPEDVMRFMQAAVAHRSELDTTGHILDFIWTYMQREPVTLLKLLILKASRTWYATDSQRFELITSVIQVGYLLLAAFAIPKAWRQNDMVRAFVICTLLVIGYFWVMTITVLPIMRYMIPAMALVMIPIPGLVTLHEKAI